MVNSEKEGEEFNNPLENNNEYDDVFNLEENKKTYKRKIFEQIFIY